MCQGWSKAACTFGWQEAPSELMENTPHLLHLDHANVPVCLDILPGPQCVLDILWRRCF